MIRMLEVGVITSTHGLKGEVKVYPTTDDAERFLDLDEVFIMREEDAAEVEESEETAANGKNTKSVSVRVESVRFFKGRPLVKFRLLDRIEDVERFKGFGIFVKREDAVPLAENEYFIADLIGSDVVLENGDPFGTLTDVLKTGANDVYVIKKSDGTEQYLPAIRDCILNVDAEAKRIVARVLREV